LQIAGELREKLVGRDADRNRKLQLGAHAVLDVSRNHFGVTE